MKRVWLLCIVLLLAVRPAGAQDGLNLPADLLVLTNEGVVQRYGLGAAGVAAISPEGQYVLDFDAAPDGNWLAYRTENVVSVVDTYSGDGLAVDTAAGVPALRGLGETIAWTPSGDALAYTTETGTRVYFRNPVTTPTIITLRESGIQHLEWSPAGGFLAAGADGDIWWLYKREGEVVTLVAAIPSSVGLTWVAEGEAVFAPTDGSLVLMNLNAANAQTLLLDNTWVYALPHLTPDGTLAVFGRQKSDVSTPEGSGRLIGLQPGSSQILTLGQAVVELNGLRWVPNSDTMAAFRGGALALFNPVTGEGFTLPITSAVAYSWGPPPLPELDGFDLPSDMFFLSDGGGEFAQVWRLPADGTPAVPVTDEPGGVLSYGISPNGQVLTFDDGTVLFTQGIDGSARTEVTALTSAPESGAQPAFSPDGSQIVYLDGGVRVIASAGGESRVLAADAIPGDGGAAELRQYAAPRFAPTVPALLAEVGLEQGVATAVIDPNSGVETRFSGANSRWLRDGRILSFGMADPTMGAMPLEVRALAMLATPQALLPATVRVVDTAEMPGGLIRAVIDTLDAFGPASLRVVDINPTTGSIALVATGGTMRDGNLSPDGTVLAGVTQGGRLTLLRLGGTQVALRLPGMISLLKWSGE